MIIVTDLSMRVTVSLIEAPPLDDDSVKIFLICRCTGATYFL